MRRILRHFRYRNHIKLSLRYVKKIASVIFLIMGISFYLLLSFDEVRATCQKAIIEIYDRYIRYSYTSDLSLEDSHVSFGYVPTGYSMVETPYVIDNYTIYQNAYVDFVELNYKAKKNADLIDNEHYFVYEVTHWQ